MDQQPQKEIVQEESYNDASAEQEENFAALFERSSKTSQRYEPGQKVKSRVAGISGDFVYLDLGGKSEAVVDLKEFLDESGQKSIEEGDEIEAFFVSFANGMRKFTTLIRGYSTIDLGGIRDAYEAGLPVNGRVSAELKGGYEVMAGKIRCFCPFSQIDLRGSREANSYIGQTFPFKIIEYKENGRNVVLSRRVLLEEEQEVKRKRFKESLQPGMDVTGKVRSIQNFGVFVDLGGVDGLIPLSEMSWSRGEKPSDLFAVGDEVTVRIIDIDWGRERITLSFKAVLPDPFLNSLTKYPPDSLVHGAVVRLESFGAFVNLEPGIDGLIPVSKLGAGRRINHPKEVLTVGQLVEARVLEVNPEKRRISLSMEQKIAPEDITFPSIGELVNGIVERVISAGILVKISDGLTGFIPNSEMGTLKGTNHSRMFPSGAPMQAVVIEIDEKRGRVVLSRSKVDEKVERDTYTQYREKTHEEEQSSNGLGSLGELLKAKLNL
ncbi:MAG TPA: S1 RNA-binding domain-containing protein [Syntrophorhabdaceae bacterium]|nr:S1 RNA-binding domain-containing protein [Syntrophorhabdaceae bacterium]